MALGFLKNIGAGDILDLGKAAIGVAGLFDKQKLPSSVSNAIGQNAEIAAALMDPSHPLFQRIASEQESQINRDFAGALRQLMIMDRRARARGAGVLNPERRDEAIAQASARGRAGAGDQARAAARTYLMNAANVNNAAFNVAQPLIAMDSVNRANQAGGIEALFDVGQRLLNGDPSGTPMQTFNINLGSNQKSNIPAIYRTKSAGY